MMMMMMMMMLLFYIYWTVHHCNSWKQKTNLMSLAIFISLLLCSIQQNSRKLLMMDILMSKTYWVHKKWNKIASDIKLVFCSQLITIYLTAIVLSPGGSGYFTCKQNMKLVTTKFKSGGLHEKHVMATGNVGNHLSIRTSIGVQSNTTVSHRCI